MNQEQCVFGCEYEETGNVNIKGVCYECGEDQRLGKCMYRVDDRGHDDEDGYCNAKAVAKYSEKTLANGASVRRCRLHYYMECCEQQTPEIIEREYESIWTDDPLNPPSGISTHQKLMDLNAAKQDLEEHLKEVVDAIQYTMEDVHRQMNPPPVDEEDLKKKL